MKKIFLLLVLIILAIYSIPAQEMQLSLGLELGIGVFNIDNEFAVPSTAFGSGFRREHEELDYVFLAPGLSFSLRGFSDTESSLLIGYFVRSRIILSAILWETSPIGNNKVTKKYTLSDDEGPVLSLIEFDFGPSVRFIISEKLYLITDFGLNVTFLEKEVYRTYGQNRILNYWGIGLYGAAALQTNLNKTMYMEFGLNWMINIISSQEGTYPTGLNQYINYEDSGRWDLFSAGVFVHIGWRIDLAAQRAASIERFLAAQPAGQSGFELVRINGGTAIRITRYAGNDSIVRIPAQMQNLPVTSIGDWAFAECNITSAVIPFGVVSIGEGAFYRNRLNSITIPGSVTSIREHAFHLNELSQIVLGANVSINGSAFDNDFAAFYNENGSRAGTYTFRDGSWSVDFEFWI